MPTISVPPTDPHITPRGADLHIVPSSDTPIAQFGAAILNGHVVAGGEMHVKLLIPFDQVPNVMPVMQFVGGVVFRVTVERVPKSEMPEGGW